MTLKEKPPCGGLFPGAGTNGTYLTPNPYYGETERYSMRINRVL